MCLDLDRLEQVVSRRTKAVVFVPLNGRSPAGLAGFVTRCRARGIGVIEDAAQALGSYTGSRHLGTLGDCGCFSFSSQKVLTTGQGGAVITDDEGLYEAMRLLRDFGRERGGADRYLRVGWNLKFTDLQAVIGLEQLRRLPAMLERKRTLFAWYRADLEGLDRVCLPPTDLEQVSPWFVDVLVAGADRAALASHLAREGIGTRPFYPALHAEPAFATPGSFPVSESLSARGLWLPSSLRLEREDVSRVCSAIRAFYAT